MLTVYDAGFITLEKQYLTLGINGMVESAEFLGLTISPNEDYQNYVIHNFDNLHLEK
jgi:ribonucleoside-triphosphate reductase (formate)